ncbi:MAG: NfeD family protein [Methanolinea sp.]|nr:NfeD family protein [Methanolinea sp.]
MVELVGLSFGWILIILGTFFLVVEASNPGFFIAVPGTVMIILGAMILLGVDVFSGPLGLVVGVAAAVCVSLFTIWLYRRINPGDTVPVTVSRDSLVGREGRVVRRVVPGTLSGKVLVSGQEWSARSRSGEIPVGATVRVVEAEGVHVVVEEVR